MPLDLNKFYLMPSVYYTFGGALGTEYGAIHHGPMAILDFGIKLNHDSMLLIGGGYRHNTPIKNEKDKKMKSYPGFEAYKPYGNFLLRLGYKW